MEINIHPAAGSPVTILSPAHLSKIRFPSEDFAACAPGQNRRQFHLDTGIPCFTNNWWETGKWHQERWGGGAVGRPEIY